MKKKRDGVFDIGGRFESFILINDVEFFLGAYAKHEQACFTYDEAYKHLDDFERWYKGNFSDEIGYIRIHFRELIKTATSCSQVCRVIQTLAKAGIRTNDLMKTIVYDKLVNDMKNPKYYNSLQGSITGRCEIKKESNNRISGSSRKNRKWKSSDTNFYLHSNVFHPYNGGSCSSK